MVHHLVTAALFGTVLDGEQELARCRVTIDGGTFTAVEPGGAPRPGDIVVEDGWIAPGLIDLHLHGAEGVDLTSAPDPAVAVASVARSLARHGVTAFCPTVGSAPAQTYERVLPAYGPRAHAGGAESLGAHLEGPYLNAERRGIHDLAALRQPSRDEVARWIALGPPALVTLAPELPGALDALRDLVSAGTVVSLGHSTADAAQAQRALSAGASHGTHLFNAMEPLHHRRPGLVGALLAGEATLEILADGVHIDPLVVRIVVRAAGARRVTLVTDGLAATGAAPGPSRFGDQVVTSDGRAVRRADGTLAGTAIWLDECLRNARTWLTWSSPADVIRMATTTSAAALGPAVAARKGRIAPGYDADAILLDRDWNVTRTYVRGVEVAPA